MPDDLSRALRQCLGERNRGHATTATADLGASSNDVAGVSLPDVQTSRVLVGWLIYVGLRMGVNEGRA